MDIQFVAQIDASADVVAFPVRKGEAGALGALLGAAATQARFEGAAGTVAETAAIDGERAKRLLLVGIGEGSEHDIERGGAALTAKLQTSGATQVQVDFASTGPSDADDVLAFAMGARLRNWRLDTYRTRLADKAKPSLKTVTIASPHGDLSARWAVNEAIADGVALTQTSFGPFPAGAFYAVHNDGNIAAFSWAEIAAALGLRSDCVTGAAAEPAG